MARALITGITGQDGALLARALLARGDEVVGTTRQAGAAAPHLRTLGLAGRVRLVALDLSSPQAVAGLVAETAVDEIYHLAGQSSVGVSFQQPAETFASIAGSTLHLLEAVRQVRPEARVVVAGSGEVFGDLGQVAASEDLPSAPASPYAAAKAAARDLVAVWRQAYGLHASTAILFNHESRLRGPHFVTLKIAQAARDIAAALAAGHAPPVLKLGNIAIARDWGWAEEHVEALVRMAGRQRPGDLVVATGTTITLEEFIAAAFAEVGLDWRRHVVSDPALLRPTDARRAAADPSRAWQELGWRATVSGAEVARRLVRELAPAG